jgi:hypothetical protein
VTHAATNVPVETRKRVVNAVLNVNTPDDALGSLRSLGATDIQVVETLASHYWTYRVRLVSPVGSHGNATAGVETDEYQLRKDAVYEAAYRVLFFKRMLPPTGPFADLADDIACLEARYPDPDCTVRRVVERLRATEDAVVRFAEIVGFDPTTPERNGSPSTHYFLRKFYGDKA